MRRYLETYPGVFTPDQIERMQAEMDRGTPPGETAEAREQRALDIIHRYQNDREASAVTPGATGNS